jgi:hypothetical protein
MVSLIKAVGADGMNGDTMDGIPSEWWAQAEAQDYPIMLQPELGFGARDWLHNLTYNTMSWAYLPYAGASNDNQGWFGTEDLPFVSKYSYLVPGHQAQICERWARQHVNGGCAGGWLGRTACLSVLCCVVCVCMCVRVHVCVCVCACACVRACLVEWVGYLVLVWGPGLP